MQAVNQRLRQGPGRGKLRQTDEKVQGKFSVKYGELGAGRRDRKGLGCIFWTQHYPPQYCMLEILQIAFKGSPLTTNKKVFVSIFLLLHQDNFALFYQEKQNRIELQLISGSLLEGAREGGQGGHRWKQELGERGQEVANTAASGGLY